MLFRSQIETGGRTIATVGRDSAFQQLPQSCDLLGFGFAHARSLRGLFLAVNVRYLCFRFYLANIRAIHAMLPAVGAARSAKNYSRVWPALWIYSLTVDSCWPVQVGCPLRALAYRTLTHPHIDHNPIANLRPQWPAARLFARAHSLTSVLRFTRRCRFFSVASLTSGTLHPRTEPRTRHATELSNQ